MSKHEELLKHRTITRTGVTEDGGWIIVFDDESHTYITPNELTDLIFRTYKILAKKSE